MHKRRYKFRNQEHRKPLLPDSVFSAPWGHCRWCSKPIYKEDGITINPRRHWHKDCVHEYLIITDSKYAKRQVKKRDKGICAKCGKFCRYRNEWDCDHIKPLIDSHGNIEYFGLSNLQTLCCDCHLLKTAQENSIRKTHKIVISHTVEPELPTQDNGSS